MTYEQLKQQARAVLDASCANAEDQRTHDNLARFDALRAAGHTAMCAAGQALRDLPCDCGGGA